MPQVRERSEALSNTEANAGCLAEPDSPVNLVADFGGTNTRVAIASGRGLVPGTVRRYRNRDFRGPKEILEEFARPLDSPRFGGFCAAVAGPVIDGHAKMTNINWTVDAATIGRTMNIPRALVINDLSALGHALDSLHDSETPLVLRGGRSNASGPRLVVNIGTGFNSALVLATSKGNIVPPSECGHTSLPVRSELEFELHRFLSSRSSFACIEDVVSGRGIETVYAWLSEREGPTRNLSASEISEQFGKGGLADRAGQTVSRILGTAIGDLALIHLPYGGIYLTGSVAKSLRASLKDFGFIEAFLNKGRYNYLMSQFSIRIIENDFASLLGCAACCAGGVAD